MCVCVCVCVCGCVCVVELTPKNSACGAVWGPKRSKNPKKIRPAAPLGQRQVRAEGGGSRRPWNTMTVDRARWR